MIFPIKKAILYLIPILILLIIPVKELTAISHDKSDTVEILFKQLSHQNPWLIREPIRKQSPTIRIGKNEFFTISLPNETPLYAELLQSNRPNGKLKIRKYDPSTGFTLLYGDDLYDSARIHINSKKSNRYCKFSNPHYIKLSFSQIPIRAYKINKYPATKQELFYIKKNALCGMIVGSYMIPYDYVEKFLNTGDHFVFPHPGFEFESNLNSSERSFYFPANRKGIIVTSVYPGVGPNFELLPGDSIYEINGVSLTRFPDTQLGDSVLDLVLRKNNHLMSIGSTVHLKFTRNGIDKEIKYRLKPFQDKDFLVPETHPYGKPPYLISGGLFFTELTGAYLKEFGEDYRKKSEKKLLYILESFHSKTHPHRDRVVILSRTLLHPNNQGYHNFQDLILNRVNGKNIRNIKSLKSLIQDNRSEFIEFEFTGQRSIVFQRDELNRINHDILKSYQLISLDNLGE